MQDRNKYIDRGWQQMTALLDKEMPLNRQRKRRAAWWLIAAGIFLILSGTGYYFSSSGRSQQSLPASPLSGNDASLASESYNPVLGELNNDNQTPGSTTLNTPGTTPVQNVKKHVTHISVMEKTNRPAPEELNERLIALESETTGTVTDNGVTEAVAETTKDLSTKKNTKYPVRQIVRTDDIALAFEDDYPLTPANRTEALWDAEITERHNISVAGLAVVQPNDLTLRVRPLPVQSVPVKQDHAPGLEAFVASHLNAEGKPFYGVEAGVGTILRAGKRTRIHTGLSYGYYNVDGLGLFGTSADAESSGNQGYPDPNTGFLFDLNEVYANNLEFVEAQQLTEKFHYLHLPLHIAHRITSRLSASAGIKASLLIAAPARYRLNDARFSASVDASSSKDFLVDYDILRRVDLAPVLGIGYQLSHRLLLEANYTHGLLHYINNEEALERSDYHRTASLGIRYRIL